MNKKTVKEKQMKENETRERKEGQVNARKEGIKKGMSNEIELELYLF